MSNQSFSTDLWARDIAALPATDREVATDLLIFAALELSCRPYHRASKVNANSDRQTIFKHPVHGHSCLVLSVVPKQDDPAPYRLRVDFFDQEKSVSIPGSEIHGAPKTQWTEKGERRFFVPAHASTGAMRSAIRSIIEASK